MGGHWVKRLLLAGYKVYAFDRKGFGAWWQLHSGAEMRQHVDARDVMAADLPYVDVVYNLAADMGGMGYLGPNDVAPFGNVEINARLLRYYHGARYFFPSSACVYPDIRGNLREDDADCNKPSTGGYGWEKLYSEKMTLAMGGQSARFHNCFGPNGSWNDGREKAPAAMLRKAWDCKKHGGPLKVWGDGEQRRVFTYVDDLLDGLQAFMDCEYPGPVNIGSERLVSINELAQIACDVVGVKADIEHIDGHRGVESRGCNASLAKELFGWECKVPLEEGMARTWAWMRTQ